jgi:hypothetical protein
MANSPSKALRICGCLLTASIGSSAFAQTTLQLNLVDRATVMQRVTDVPRKNPDREAKIKDLFNQAGCSDSISEQPVKHSKLPNAMCLLKGQTDQVIIVGAHFDSISPAEGIIDNWSGASLLASLYQGLKSQPRQHSFLFIAFTDEEQGLVGSAYYVDHMTRDEVAKTSAMVNLDTLGLTPTKVWVHHADLNLVNALSTVAHAMHLPLAEVDVERVGRADSDSFTPRNIPRITIHSLTRENIRILHSSRDTVKELHFDDYYDTYRLVSAYLVYLDQTLRSGDEKEPQKPASK